MKDTVAELEVGIKELAAEERGGWSGPSLSERVREVWRPHEALEVEMVRLIADWDGSAAWSEDGALTPVSWLTANLPVTKGQAIDLVKVARLRARHRAVAEGLDGATLCLAKARILARAERGREEIFAACVDGLVELAASMSVADFAQVIAIWVEQVDDTAPVDDASRAFRSADTSGGMSRGVLWGPTDDMAIVRAAIDTLAGPDPADCPEGPRTRAQREYDAVIDIFRRVLADQLGEDPDSIGGADVVVDADTAAEVTADPDDGSGQERLEVDDLAQRRCEHTTGERATRAFAAALICSGYVRKVIRDPRNGNVLEYGRSHRLFSRMQRRALAYRDRGCVFPGCDRDPRWCDAHHLQPWEEGGLTDIVNGVLLCRRHHRLIHAGWRLRRDALTGVVTATAPDGREFTRHPGERC